MKKNCFLSLFFITFFKLFVFSQQEEETFYFSNLKDSVKYYANLKHYEKSISYAKLIIEKRNKKNEKELANDYFRLGYYFKKQQETDSAYYHYIKSSKLYFKNKDTFLFAKQLYRIAKLESDQGLYNKSDSSAISALKYLKKDNSLFSSIYNCLAINSSCKKEHNEALKWYNLAIKTTTDSIKKLRYLSNNASIYTELKNYKNAFFNYNQIKNNTYYDSIPLGLKALILDNLAFASFLDKREIKESDFLKAQNIKQKLHDNRGLIANYSHLSDFHKKKNSSRSLFYAYKMYGLTKKLNLPNDRIEALDKIIALEDNAIIRKFASERNRITDSLQFAKQQSQNKFAKIIYNYEEEEKQKLKAQVALAKQKAQKTQIIFVSLLVLIIFLIFLYYKHQKSKKEKIIEVYKTETRLAKKIHDELANGVYLIMNKVQNLTTHSKILLPDLEKIYALTRDISHENSPVNTGSQFETFLKQLFSEFNKKDCKVFIKGLTDININSLKSEKQIVVYRLLNELFVNMDKHSKATLVIISFTEEKGTISIHYKDNGVGVEMLKSRHGLQNMETRIKAINGLFNFDSEEGKGLKATIQFKK